jgi:hypothetical protein
MKEYLVVDLDKNDVEKAITEYLKEFGYEAEEIKALASGPQSFGARVKVIKEDK